MTSTKSLFGRFGKQIDDPAGGCDNEAGYRFMRLVEESVNQDPGVYDEKKGW